MGWAGYMVLDGTEIANCSRTEAYCAAAGMSWFKPVYRNEALRPLLGEDAYATPSLDIAPWYDEDIDDSNRFYGFYPLEVTGLEDSSRSASVVEYTGPGGSPGRVRAATKSTVWSGVLMGEDEQAVEYGMRWLRRALLGGRNSLVRADQTALGVTMQYLSAEPILPEYLINSTPIDGDTVILDGGDAGGIPADTEATPDQALKMYQRFLLNSKVDTGPTVDRKIQMTGCNGVAWVVQFTVVSGSPYEFGAPEPILQGYMDPAVTYPWVPGAPVGQAETAWRTWTEVDCTQRIYQPLYDPLCAVTIVPPAPPSIPYDCYTAPSSWKRRKVSLNPDIFPIWEDMVPVLTVYSVEEMRNLRVRWYANPDGDFDPDDNPCDFVGDWVISYLPAGATMVIDGMIEQVRVTTALGAVRRADSLVFQNNSSPIVWPVMSRGFGWIMTLDKPTTAATDPVIDLTFVPRAAI